MNEDLKKSHDQKKEKVTTARLEGERSISEMDTLEPKEHTDQVCRLDIVNKL
jgi:hypothetical protein